MATKEELTQLVIDGKMSVVDFICETTEQTYKRAQEKNPDILWSMDAVLAHWQMIRDEALRLFDSCLYCVRRAHQSVSRKTIRCDVDNPHHVGLFTKFQKGIDWL